MIIPSQKYSVGRPDTDAEHCICSAIRFLAVVAGRLIVTLLCCCDPPVQVMKTYHMYHAETISAEGKLKEAEKQEEKQIGRGGDAVFSVRMEDKHQRRSSVKKMEKMKEKVRGAPGRSLIPAATSNTRHQSNANTEAPGKCKTRL